MGFMDRIKGMFGKATDAAGDAVDKAKDVAGDAVDKVQDVAGDVVDKAKDVVDDVKDKFDGDDDEAGEGDAAAEAAE
ncbi:MAG: CsbD family protein [Actinomycetota bacterium]